MTPEVIKRYQFTHLNMRYSRIQRVLLHLIVHGIGGNKKGTIDVIYRWKAYLLEIQKIHVNIHKSVKGRSYGYPS